MSPIALAFLALSLSADAFAVATGKGVSLKKTSARDAMRAGAVFGSIEAFNLFLGWALGSLAGAFVTSVDHWIAFAILGALGVKMIHDYFKGEPEDEDKPKPSRHKITTLAFAAVGSSIDSMGVGVTLAFIDQSIIPAVLAVGLATFIMASLGVAFGPLIGGKIGKLAEAVGGAVLILIGVLILAEHTGVL